MSDNQFLNNLFGLEGKTAAVIGGTGELCGAMAESLAQAGAEVVLVGRSQEKASQRLERIEQRGGRGYFLPADMKDPGAFKDLHEAISNRSDKVDILINGAGVNAATPFFEISLEEFQQLLDVNIKAVFQACQVFGKAMVDRGEGGSIINVGSMSGIIPLSRVFTYSMTKAAVHNLSKNLAREWAQSRVRVNTIVPGFFPAEQNRKVLTEDRISSIMRHTPMNRFGEADELAGAALLLASEKAGSFITGLELVVDGGYASMTI